MATWGDYSLRAMIKKIVGANWDGTTLETINANNIKLKITEQPTDTSASTITVRTNCFGNFWQLYKVSESGERSYATQGYSPVQYITAPLTNITETSVCCIGVSNGQNEMIYSNNFTVTRTSAQTQALKENLTSGKLDTEVAETDVVETTIDKMETETVVAKTTTTKSK